MYIVFILGVVFATTHAMSPEMFPLEKSAAQFVPVLAQFVTLEDQFYPGDRFGEYHVALCGGCQFDGLTAYFAVKLVDSPWDDDMGNSINVIVTDSKGNIVATNHVGPDKSPVPDFSFTYYSKYGDLFFNVSTNSAPSFLFALSLSFDYNKRAFEPRGLCQSRWEMTADEYENTLRYTKGNDNFRELLPIFKTEVQEQVLTQELAYLRLDYCFGGMPHYHITISTIADDQQSGLATYACKKTYSPTTKCDFRTPTRDTSGGPVNFVLVGLDGPHEYGPVYVIIRGHGRYGLQNHFTLAASAPK